MTSLSLLPLEVQKTNRKKICDPIRGPHLYFRHIKDAVQARLHAAIPFDAVPQVFLFGSPHIDNYARTNTGVGMIDFDSAMMGPYLCDVFSLFLSVQLRRENFQADLSQAHTDAFLDGYLRSLDSPDLAFDIYQPLQQQAVEPWQESVESYIAHGKKWAKKMLKFPLPNEEPILNSILTQYFESLDGSDWRAEYELTAAGHGVGSMGRLHHLMVLQSQDTKELKLIDIKHTRNYILPHWPHHQFYSHPYDHDGKRMIAASRLHAPGVTDKEGFATYQGISYWGCELPTINLKIKGLLNDEEATAFSYAVGTQIGKSHAQSVGNASDLARHIQSHYNALLDVTESIRQDAIHAWENYVDYYQTNY